MCVLLGDRYDKGGCESNDSLAMSYRDTALWRRSVPSSSTLFCSPGRLFFGAREDLYIVCGTLEKLNMYKSALFISLATNFSTTPLIFCSTTLACDAPKSQETCAYSYVCFLHWLSSLPILFSFSVLKLLPIQPIRTCRRQQAHSTAQGNRLRTSSFWQYRIASLTRAWAFSFSAVRM